MNDKQLIKMAKEFRGGVLNGSPSTAMCAVVSWPLQGYLGMFGIDAECCESEVDLGHATTNHVFLRLPDGRVLDATADQFDSSLPPVYLGAPLWIHEVKANQ